MTGTPVEVIETDADDCKTSHGTTLTFQRARSNTVDADGATTPAETQAHRSRVPRTRQH